LLRLESPGENAAVTQGLLHWGAAHVNHAAWVDPAVPPSKGSLSGLLQQHLGFVQLLDTLEQECSTFPHLQWVNSLDYIRLCFDKQQCHQHLQQQGIKVPPALYSVQNYEDLRQKMQQKGWSRVFVKPLHGSSASGVVAFRTQGQRLQATTSVEMQVQQGKVALFNSLRLRQYSNEKDIATLINCLAKEGIMAEQWIPKASLGKAVFDLRMVVIGGQCQQVVVRQSQSPLTNLHLGNRRGSLEQLKEKMGMERWNRVETLAIQTAAQLPAHQYACLDILVSTDLEQGYILEVNAFGDLLPRVLYQGRNTYQAVLNHLKQQHYA
jgi:glutathione synthase/RimK-type ligase-like ATP-grasp enzyme